MKRLRIAFAGFRHNHIFSLYENVLCKSEQFEVCGAYEADEATLKILKEKNIKVTYSSFEELLNDKSIDVVAIGDYYGKRGSMVISALNAGKHIISDKPLCTSVKELEVIEKISNDNNLKVGIMLDLRDNRNFSTAIGLIDDCIIGKINNIVFTGQHPLQYGVRPNWYFEKGKHGGVINDIAIHGVDICRLITKSDIDKIFASRCWNGFATQNPDFLDSAQIMFSMKNGAGVIADISYSAPNGCGFNMSSYWRFLVCGEKGTIEFDYNGDSVKVFLSDETEVKEYNSKEKSEDYLDRFYYDIKNSNGNTAECLKSTLQTLKIQENANNN